METGRMKFRLRTLFALTAISGASFFLARINPWLPVLPLVMFCPLTVVYFKRPSWIPATIIATLTLWLTGVVILDACAARGLGFLPGSVGNGLCFYVPGDSWRFGFNIGSLVVTSSLIGEPPVMYLSHPLLMLFIAAYGLALQFLAWLVRRRAKAGQPA